MVGSREPGGPGVVRTTALYIGAFLAETFAYARRTGIGGGHRVRGGTRRVGWAAPERPLVLVQPVNDAALAIRLRTRGADGIYTGYLARPILERILSGSDGVP